MGVAPVEGWKEGWVVAPPSMTDALPLAKLVASPLTTTTIDDEPGGIFVGSNWNPITLPLAFRSAMDGAAVPFTKTPPGRDAPSVRKPTDVATESYALPVRRLIA